MKNYDSALKNLQSDELQNKLKHIYGEGNFSSELERYILLLEKHKKLYHSNESLFLISAPGRIEVVGNHTDHNNGKVLTAAINKDSLACVSKRNDNNINIYSDGYDSIKINVEDLSLNKSEYNTTTSIVKGIAFRMREEGYKIGGFDACINSTVLSGSGLSSSASIEILLVTIFDALFNNNNMSPLLKAKIGQFAENDYFGKPSGLLDQSASAIGGLVYIDFKNSNPEIKPISMDFSSFGYEIIVVNTNSRHDNLTSAYAAIPKEMKDIAKYFGKSTLIEVDFKDILNNIDKLRENFGERPLLRALHFYNENSRVENIMAAIEENNIQSILNNIIASGVSSFMYLQNIYAHEDYQPMSLALALSEQILKSKGAWRIHGGGFAGTTLNIVPFNMIEEFENVMEKVFGNGACLELNIRPIGPYVIAL